MLSTIVVGSGRGQGGHEISPPGGMPGAQNFHECQPLVDLLKKRHAEKQVKVTIQYNNRSVIIVLRNLDRISLVKQRPSTHVRE